MATMTPDKQQPVYDELSAMRACSDAMEPLLPAQRARCIKWLTDVYGSPPTAPAISLPSSLGNFDEVPR